MSETQAPILYNYKGNVVVFVYGAGVCLALQRDAAYPCFCSRQRLEELRFKGQRSGYDGRCRQLPQKTVQENLSMSLPHTIRMKVR